jgi:hypothetical protein
MPEILLFVSAADGPRVVDEVRDVEEFLFLGSGVNVELCEGARDDADAAFFCEGAVGGEVGCPVCTSLSDGQGVGWVEVC